MWPLRQHIDVPGTDGGYKNPAFCQNTGREREAKIKECLKMIAYEMGSTLLTFVDKYYKYNGKREIQDNILTIGGYKLAWHADLVAASMLENWEDLFDNNDVYDKIYRDNGLVIINRVRSNGNISKGLNSFQKRVNEIIGYKGLVFTVSISGEEKKLMMWNNQKKQR
jgi:hypothetical protein